MSLQLMYIGGGGGHYNCKKRLLRICKMAYPTEMLMEMVSQWLFITVKLSILHATLVTLPGGLVTAFHQAVW
jgi:hypothetical protein